MFPVAMEIDEQTGGVEVEGEGGGDAAQPNFPALVFPHFPEAGKGWNPQAYKTETEMLQGSRDFVEAIKAEQWLKVNELLKFQVDLDFQNDLGEAPIHLAIACRHEKLVRFLISYPNYVRGDTIDLDVTTDEGKTPLHYACAHNCLRLVAILLHCGVNVHRITKTDGENALHFAAYWGNIRIAKRLIRRGIDFTCKAGTLGTPLEYARARKHPEMVSLLEGCIERQAQMLKEHMDQLREEERKRWAASWSQPSWSQTRWHNTGWGSSAATNQLTLGQPTATSGWMWTGGKWVQVGEPASRPSTRRKINFVQGDDEDDVVIFDPVLADEEDYGLNYSNGIKCECCDNVQLRSRTFCKDCGYVLNDTCPNCGVNNLDFETCCLICGTELWAEIEDDEEEHPSDPYAPVVVTGTEAYGDYGDYSSIANVKQREPVVVKEEEEVEREEQEMFWGISPLSVQHQQEEEKEQPQKDEEEDEEQDWGEQVFFYPQWKSPSYHPKKH